LVHDSEIILGWREPLVSGKPGPANPFGSILSNAKPRAIRAAEQELCGSVTLVSGTAKPFHGRFVVLLDAVACPVRNGKSVLGVGIAPYSGRAQGLSLARCFILPSLDSKEVQTGIERQGQTEHHKERENHAREERLHRDRESAGTHCPLLFAAGELHEEVPDRALSFAIATTSSPAVSSNPTSKTGSPTIATIAFWSSSR
jgi:hypothetical protein